MKGDLPIDYLPTMSKLHELHEMHSIQEFKIEDFPTDILPPILRDMVKEVSRVTQTPESMSGCLILGIVSAALGKVLKLKDSANRVTGGNLYIILSADSGTGKTLCAKELFKPFIDVDQNRLDHWKTVILPELQKEEIKLEEEENTLRSEYRREPKGAKKESILDNLTEIKSEGLD